MKKLVLVFSVFILSMIITPNVNAASFFEGEFIPNIFMIREKNGTRYFQRARFFRQSGTNGAAYCIQPFVMFVEGGTYSPVFQPDYLTDNQRQRIALLSSLGYGFEHRTDNTWYAVTQLLIWEAGDPDGIYYFTDTLNGNYTNKFNSYIDELNLAVDNFLRQPSFSNQSFQFVENQEISLMDNNNVLSFYQSIDSRVHIDGNRLIIDLLEDDDYSFELKRISNAHGKPVIFYVSNNSQDQVIMGDIEPLTTTFNISVRRTRLEIKKIDRDTGTTTPSGEGQLHGAVFNLYNEDMEFIQELVIGNDFKAYLNNIPFGNYFIKEISPGIGYTLDSTIHPIVINIENPNLFLQLSNKIIEREIEIFKLYGDGNTSKPEPGIIFDIFDHKDELIVTIVTDQSGFASVTLPFGRYRIVQRNTTPGYQKIDSFYFNVDLDQDLTFELYNYRIPVPDTGITNDQKQGSFFPLLLLGLGTYQKRKII